MNADKLARMKELEETILSSEQPIAEKTLLAEYQTLYDEQQAEERAKAMVLSKEMRNRRRRGKYGEKRVSKELGVRRSGGVGQRDVGNSMFSYEVKTLKTLPASIVKIMAQAERLKKKGTIAVGVFRCNSPRQEYFVLERNSWLELHGK